MGFISKQLDAFKNVDASPTFKTCQFADPQNSYHQMIKNI